MIKVTGKFKEYKSKVILVLRLEEDLFEEVKEHITMNMFFSYRRIAPKFKKVLLSSIGDNIDNNNRQDLSKAEVSIEVSMEQDVNTDLIYLLNQSDSWFVCALHKEKTFVFSVNKDNQLIDARTYTVIE